MVRRRKLTNLKSLKHAGGSQHGFRIQNSSPGGVQRLFLTVESLIAFGRFQIFFILPHPPLPPRRLRHPPPRLGPPHPHRQHPPPPRHPLQRRRHCCRSLSSASCGPPRRPLHFSSGPSAPLRRAPRQLRRS